MNTKIKELQAKLAESHGNCESIETQIQKEYNKVFDDSKALAKAIANAENSSEYMMGEYGEVESWYRYYDLQDYHDCKEQFEAWLSDNHSMRVDWQNDCLIVGRGDDNLMIQDQAGRDNGVWQSGKRVIDEAAYRDEDGEIDTDKRDALIEAHMEQTGYFPGVFRVDYHGNLFAVNTLKQRAV